MNEETCSQRKHIVTSPAGKRICKTPAQRKKCKSLMRNRPNGNKEEDIINFRTLNLTLGDECGTDDSIDIEKSFPYKKKKQPKKEISSLLQGNNEVKQKSHDRVEEPVIQKPHSKTDKKMDLSDMERELLKQVTIIQYEKSLYYYTGRTYKIIENSDELLRIIRSKVSNSGFNCNSTRWSQDLLTFMIADDSLIPEDCVKKISEASLYVVFRNGVLDLRTLKLMKHSKEYLTFYELDAEWAECSRPKVFEDFVTDISNGDSSIGIRILEMMGYLLSPYNQGKKFFVMGTAHDSGKSTIGELLEQLIGCENVAHLSTYQLGNRFSLGNIRGKILNLAMDLPKGKLDRIATSIIKMTSGGDKIATEQKYERMKEIHSNMRFLFASNYPVTIPGEDDDDAFWERMILIPFTRSIDESKRDIYLIKKLLNEKNGIIYMCFIAFHKMLKRNGQFTPCKAAEKMKAQWRYGEDNDLSYTVRQFLEECIEITGEDTDDIYSKDLYEQYKDYCAENQFDMLSYNRFVKWCDENLANCRRCRIHHDAKENPRLGYKGIKWK